MINKDKNPWTKEDEKEHFPSVMEWWCAITFFKTIEDNKKWSFKGSFAEWVEKTKKGSVFNTTFFNQTDNKNFLYHSRNDKEKLDSSEHELHIRYDDSSLKGSYPNYELFFHDKKNNMKLHLNYEATSLPHWIAQDVTDGWLPMGLGFYRYGFIPKCKVTGELTIDDKKYHIQGDGYFEHVWGDIWYDNPLASLSNIKKTLSVYFKLMGWWIKNHRFKIPKTLKFSTENNPFGYDWSWALLDNGWTIFYGNILFWVMQGPIFGTLTLSKDGINYNEFCHVNFQYNKIEYSKKYDFYYPSEIEITATKGEEKIHLIFKKTGQKREYESRFQNGKYWKAFVICEAPGVVEGEYYNGKEKTKLSGVCKIEPQRQVSVIGHNSLHIDFIKPPQGIGISFDLESHYLKKKIMFKKQLAPRPKIKFNSKKIDSSKINKN